MTTAKGTSVLGGIAIGRIFVWHGGGNETRQKTVTDINTEINRFLLAKAKAMTELDELHSRTLKEADEQAAMIFEAHQMFLEDDDFSDAITGMITKEHVNAEYAVKMQGENFAASFAALDDDYMKERAADFKDISARLIRILEGRTERELDLENPAVILAEDLTPSETIRMDKNKVVSFVTSQGSVNSHTAIIARSLSLPSLINTEVEILEAYHGKPAIVDGYSGTFYIDPDEKVLQEYQSKWKAEQEKKESLRSLIGKQNTTKDGRTVNLYANIGGPDDVENVLKNDAGGIGLFRSEFLYLGRNDFPGEEEQFQNYKLVASKMQGRKVIIRTLDIGADKKADYFGLEKEENPAMGYRAIRICLTRQDIFKTQLRAILRASAFGNIAIMFPMIISMQELTESKQILSEVKKELTAEGRAFGKVETGIMVETPAAAVMSDELAKEADFFSIGTNDLTQYTLAVDRQNQKLERFMDTHHPAVLRLVETTIRNAHKEGKWVGICGELAADTTLTKIFLDMGVDELSVAASAVLKVRDAIRQA